MNNLQRVILLTNQWGITLVSYGLAPNPNGFCFEITGEEPPSVVQALNFLLDILTKEEVEELRFIVFGLFRDSR